MPVADRHLILVAIAACGGTHVPAITNTSEAKAASVILLASDGFAAPIACSGTPKLEGGEACAKQLPEQPQLRSATANLTTFGWADRHVCPWQPEPIATRGLLQLCREDECAMPEQLMVWPPTSSATLEKIVPIDANDPRLAADVAVVRRPGLLVKHAFSVGADRIVIVYHPRPQPHPRDLEDAHWTVVSLANGGSHVLADAACSGRGHELVGVIDLDGHRLVVMKHQYQIVLYKVDGTILLEGPACCGF